jgi:all-beta uncharacterized protein
MNGTLPAYGAASRMTGSNRTSLLQSLTLLLAVCASSCGSGSTTLLTPTPPLALRCAVALRVSSATVGSAGGTGILTIDTARECRWTVSADATWLTFSSDASGQGPSEVSYSIQPSRSTSPRSVALSVSDQRAVISQEPATCPSSVSPVDIEIGPSGGEKRASLVAEDYCAWAVSSRASWITITSETSGTGPAEIAFRISDNDGDERTGVIEVAGAKITIRQRQAVSAPPVVTPPPPPGCSYAITPNTYTPASGGGAVQVSVTTAAGCAWTVSGNPSWTSASPSAAMGAGISTVTVQANSGGARSATFQIAGREFRVAQLAAPCTYTVKPLLFDLSDNKQTRRIDVTTQPACPVGARSSVSWIQIASSPSFGSGEVTLKIEENRGRDSRTGLVTISGQNFTRTVTITQDGR